MSARRSQRRVGARRPALFFSPIAQTGLAILLLATAYAFWAGDRLVRVAALANAINWLLDNALQPRTGGLINARRFPEGPFLADLAFAALFVGLAVWSKRTWMAVMTGFLILGVANYASHLTEMRLWHRAFITAGYLWGYGALLALIMGAEHARRRRVRPA